MLTHALSLLSPAVQHGTLAVFIGAGVHAAPPTALPEPYQILSEVITALGARLGQIPALTHAPDLAAMVTEGDGRLAPDLWLRLTEQEAMTPYLEVLRALDSTVPNPHHLRVAHLAKLGQVRVIVTRALGGVFERTLEKLGVPYQVVYTLEMFERLANEVGRVGRAGQPVWVLKLSGTLDDANSVSEMLRARRLGLDGAVRRVLAHVAGGATWLVLGERGAWLDREPDALSLGLAKAWVWQAYPPERVAAGVRAVAAQSGGRGQVAEVGLGELLAALAPDAPTPLSALGAAKPEDALRQRVVAWVASLSVVHAVALFGMCVAPLGQRGAAFIHAAFKHVDTTVGRHDAAYLRVWRLNVEALMTLGRITEAWDAAHPSGSSLFELFDDLHEWHAVQLTRVLPSIYGGDVRGAIRTYGDLYYHPDLAPRHKLRAALGLAEALQMDGQTGEALELLRDQPQWVALANDDGLTAQWMYRLGELEAISPSGDVRGARRAVEWLTERAERLSDDVLAAHAQSIEAQLAYRMLRVSKAQADADRALSHIEQAFVVYQEREVFHDMLRTTLLAREICLFTGDAQAAAQLYDNAAPLLERYLVYQTIVRP